MDFKTFLENFDTIAQAPNGIAKLRSLILNLAVRGKLDPQNPEDESAENLFRDIQLEKEEAFSLRKFKRTKPLLSMNKKEVYELPPNWKWIRLSDICFQVTDGVHKTPKYVDSGIPFLSVNNLRDNRICFQNCKFISLEEHTELIKRCRPQFGDILLGKVGSIGVCDVIQTNQEFSIFVQLALLKPVQKFIESFYIKYLLLSDLVRDQILAGSAGSALQYIGIGKIQELLIPLPPLAEQKRIVEKVDELMALCDRLQASQETRDNLRQKLRASAIASLMNAETDEELKKGWAIVRDNWHTLSQKPEDVDDLRRSVLQLALRGRLATQNEQDESASELLEKIREKRLRFETKAANKNNILNEASVDGSYQIPENWIWCFASQLCYLITDGDHNPPPRVKSGIPHLTAKNVVCNSIDLHGCTFISEEDFERVKQRYFPKPGDLLLTCVGTLGRTAIVPENLVFSADRNLAVLRLVADYVLPQYVQLILNGPEMQDYIERANGKTAQPHIYLKQIRSLLCPLPPLAEQKRIVAKVDELMQMCDQLEESLRQSQQRVEALAASAISHLTI